MAAEHRRQPHGPHAHLYLLNKPNAREVLDRRLRDFSELLGIERDRLRDWGIAFCAASAANEADQRARSQETLAVAEILVTL